MRYIAAYMLQVLGGNAHPTSDDVRNVISSVGVDIDEEQLKLVMQKLAGKNLEEIQEAGQALLANSVFGTNVSTPDATVREDAVKPEVKEQEKEKDSDTDSGEEGFGNLFD